MGRWAALALVTTAYGFSALAALAVAPLAPFLLEALDLSRGQVGLLLPAVYLGGVIMATHGYALPWLTMSTTAVLVAVALPRLKPLVRRGSPGVDFTP